MALSEEPPFKIRKLSLGLDDSQVAGSVPSAPVGSFKTRTDDAVNFTENDAVEDISSALPGTEAVSSSLSGDNVVHGNDISRPMSKSQIKKLLKMQNWEQGREYRKAKRKEKEKQKKIRKAEARVTANYQNAEDALLAPEGPKRSNRRPMQLPITFILDCGFDDLMTEAELISLGAQLTRCYSDNRSAPYRAHLIVTSFGGKLKHRFETVLASNHLGWKSVKFMVDDFVAAATEADTMMRGSQGGHLVGAFSCLANDVQLQPQLPLQSKEESTSSKIVSSGPPPDPDAAADTITSGLNQLAANGTVAPFTVQDGAVNGASTQNGSTGMARAVPEDSNAHINNLVLQPLPKPSIVYLTSDSPHTLDTLSPYTTYIIGGIVDKNRHKGICYKRAMARDIPTAKLPIGEYMTMQSRSVLATNHVVEIMLKWLEYGDWAKAFLEVIPKRKEARLKAKQGKTDDLPEIEDSQPEAALRETEILADVETV